MLIRLQRTPGPTDRVIRTTRAGQPLSMAGTIVAAFVRRSRRGTAEIPTSCRQPDQEFAGAVIQRVITAINWQRSTGLVT